jgi:hypothetical protein
MPITFDDTLIAWVRKRTGRTQRVEQQVAVARLHHARGSSHRVGDVETSAHRRLVHGSSCPDS